MTSAGMDRTSAAMDLRMQPVSIDLDFGTRLYRCLWQEEPSEADADLLEANIDEHFVMYYKPDPTDTLFPDIVEDMRIDASRRGLATLGFLDEVLCNVIGDVDEHRIDASITVAEWLSRRWDREGRWEARRQARAAAAVSAVGEELVAR